MDEFLCLANSQKLGGRCLAGYASDPGWVRPVSDAAGGKLPSSGVSHIGLLELVEINLAQPEPLASQPENFLFAPQVFSARTGTASEVAVLLARAEDPDPELLLRGRPDRISETEIKSSPLSGSLALIAPTDVRWSVRVRPGRSFQPRCLFSFQGRDYDLSVTDPTVYESLRNLDEGQYPPGAAGLSEDDRVLLTISLGEEYDDGYHYKLVAGLIVEPPVRS